MRPCILPPVLTLRSYKVKLAKSAMVTSILTCTNSCTLSSINGLSFLSCSLLILQYNIELQTCCNLWIIECLKVIPEFYQCFIIILDVGKSFHVWFVLKNWLKILCQLVETEIIKSLRLGLHLNKRVVKLMQWLRFMSHTSKFQFHNFQQTWYSFLFLHSINQ